MSEDERGARLLTITGNPFQGLAREFLKDIVTFAESCPGGEPCVFEGSVVSQYDINLYGLMYALVYLVNGYGYLCLSVKGCDQPDGTIELEVSVQRLS